MEYYFNKYSTYYPFCSIRLYKGFGMWAGINMTYGTLCVWLPFCIMYIVLPKIFKRKAKATIVYKKHFWYDVRFTSFGLYLDLHNKIGIRLPFLDIYLLDCFKCIKK